MARRLAVEEDELFAKAVAKNEGGAQRSAARRAGAESEAEDMKLANRLQDLEMQEAKSAASTASPAASGLKHPPQKKNKQCFGCKGLFLTSSVSSTIITVGELKYHPSCFTCAACSSPITERSFNFAKTLTDESGRPLPVHSSCYAELFVPKCVVCRSSVPLNSRNAYVYSHHPFFEEWRYCSKHEGVAARCGGCHVSLKHW